MPLEVGLIGRATLTVAEPDLATSLGSGDVPALGTPRLVALVEEASMAALSGHLGDDTTSVGMRVHVDHLQPSALGAEVAAEAVLERIDGRRLTFAVSATQNDLTVAEGQIIRVVVETGRFLEKLTERG